MPRPRKSSTFDPHASETCDLTLNWIFMLLLDFGGHRHLIDDGFFNQDEIARELGIAWLEAAHNQPPEAGASPADATTGMANATGTPSFRLRALAELKRARQRFDKARRPLLYPDRLAANLAQLAQLIGLDQLEQKLLGFCALLHTECLLEEALKHLKVLGFNATLRILGALLQAPPEALRECLSGNGRLVQTGLIAAYQRKRRELFHDGFELLSCNNSDLMLALRHHDGHAIDLFSSAFRRASSATLAAADFAHLDGQLAIVRPYLRQALANATPGVNVLLYGPPGTGKSQLTRLLASELQAELFEIACTDTQGEPIDRQGRFSALRAAMRVLNPRHTLLVMDEIEDLFSGNRAFLQVVGGDSHKGWVNRMLEENPVPCFWLTNQIEALDTAYIRRFDLVLKLDNPPKAQRERLIRHCAGERLGPHLVEQLAAHEHLMPAVITRALNVARHLEAAPGPALDIAVTRLVDATLSAQDCASLAPSRRQSLPALYSPDLSLTDLPLGSLLEGLRSQPEARLCFYGPSGTGKTAYGHWLAQQLGLPLLSRRACDLISPYLGVTERNVAHAFEQARSEGAVLLLDEVDSFLQDRRKARHSWEISAVNEMLTQMEHYSGLFIASTNLMQDLDEAALRRFDLKIHFGYLSPAQLADLLERHLRQLQLPPPSSASLARLLRKACLTPGDFALLARRARFSPFSTAEQVIDALLAEGALKTDGQSHPIGFIH